MMAVKFLVLNKFYLSLQWDPVCWHQRNKEHDTFYFCLQLVFCVTDLLCWLV